MSPWWSLLLGDYIYEERLGLLTGWPSKIEVIGALGIHTLQGTITCDPPISGSSEHHRQSADWEGDMWPLPGGYYISIVGAWKGTMCRWGYLKKNTSTKNGPQKSWGPRFRSAHLRYLEATHLWSSRVLKIRWSAQWTRDGALPDLIDLVKNGVWETSDSPTVFSWVLEGLNLWWE